MEWLPQRLPQEIKPVWSVDTAARGLGGVAATSQFVIFSDRGLNDTLDVFTCLSAETGQQVWSYTFPAVGNLDYGNSPRATPVIDGDLVYVMGAFGNLACLELKTGKSVWEIDLWIEFEPEDQPKWGACSTPLLIDGKLIVNPGAKSASLAALDAKNGKVLWKTPGRAAGYGSLILAEFGGKKQIVGHDADSLNGWDPATGKNLWRLVPPQPNDFNVPTPIVWKDKLIVITENNKTRVFEFHKDGTINPKPIAVNTRLAPDTHSPVVVGNKLLGAWRRLYCLDLAKNLKPVYDNDDEVFQKYCAIVATEERALAISMRSELLLFDVTQDEFTLISKTRILPKEEGVYSHPAFVGKRMYLRGSSTVVAIDLE